MFDLYSVFCKIVINQDKKKQNVTKNHVKLLTTNIVFDNISTGKQYVSKGEVYSALKTIKELREKRKLTQRETAKLLDITKEYLSMIECGKRNPSDSLKEKLSKLYNVSISDIFLSLKETKRLKD